MCQLWHLIASLLCISMINHEYNNVIICRYTVVLIVSPSFIHIKFISYTIIILMIVITIIIFIVVTSVSSSFSLLLLCVFLFVIIGIILIIIWSDTNNSLYITYLINWMAIAAINIRQLLIRWLPFYTNHYPKIRSILSFGFYSNFPSITMLTSVINIKKTNHIEENKQTKQNRGRDNKILAQL